MERLNEFDKAKLLGFLVGECGIGALTLSDLRRLAAAVDAAFSDDLEQFLDPALDGPDSGNRQERPHRERLVAAGLTRVATFDYVRDFFKESLAALSERNPGIQGRLLNDPGDSSGAVIFRNGQRMAGCRIRFGGMFGSDGISYSNNENAGGNSTNELLSVGADKHSLHLKSSFGSFHRQTPDKLSQEGAAEHLWTLLIEPLQ